MKLEVHLRKNAAIWLFLLFFWSICLAFLSLYGFDKVETHILLNQWTTDALDGVMTYTTHLGDGWVMLLVTIVLFFVSTRYFLNFALTGLCLTPVVYLLKHYFDKNRPFFIFEEMGRLQEIYVPEQEVIHLYSSFPSGHAAVAFAMATILALLAREQINKFLWLLLAVFVSGSRVYLSQHFLEDILVGSFLGCLFAFLSYQVLDFWKINQVDSPFLTWWRKK